MAAIETKVQQRKRAAQPDIEKIEERDINEKGDLGYGTLDYFGELRGDVPPGTRLLDVGKRYLSVGQRRIPTPRP
ncbi:MAG: hypothetical protein ACLQAT_19535 [Candidatus Binataceae bacterium]